MNLFKDSAVTVIGVICSYVAYLLGGWDSSITTLLIFMGADYLSGLIVAAVFKKSGKTENGAISSRAGLIGILKKCGMLLGVLVGAQLDIVSGNSGILRNTVIIAFIANECISIVENLGLMGVGFPDTVTQAIEVLKGKSKDKEEK